MKDLFSSGFAGMGESTRKNQLKMRYTTDLKAFKSLLKSKKDKAKRTRVEAKLFRSLGLVISLLMVITAFQWKFADNGGVVDLSGNARDSFEDLLDVPVTEQPPPPPPAKQAIVNIVEVSDEEEIIEEIDVDFDIEVNEETTVQEVIYEATDLDMEEEEAEEIFMIVEEQPEPIGGTAAFYKFVAEELDYPDQARRTGIEGKVFVQFVVDKEGNLTQPKIAKGIGGGCDEEALRVISKAPKWKPGKQRGKPVSVIRIIPIHFKLMDAR